MRNRLVFGFAALAILVNPMAVVAEPSFTKNHKVDEKTAVKVIQSKLDLKVGLTKEEIAQKEIEANLKKLEEKARLAQEAAKAKALTKPKITYIKVNSNSGNADAIAYGRLRNAQVFGEDHWLALYQLWSKESGWRDTALNKRSGACGIPQFINGCILGDHVSQIERGLVYIKNRYGNPTNAWRFWLAHRWY